MWREIRDHGYRGSLRTVLRFVRDLRQDAHTGSMVGREQSPFTRRRGPAVRDVLSALLRPARQRSPGETQYLEYLMTEDPAFAPSYALVQEFMTLVRQRQGDRLTAWMNQIAAEGCAALQRFANGLQDDWDAIVAGLTYAESNGVTEGHMHRLKLPLEPEGSVQVHRA